MNEYKQQIIDFYDGRDNYDNEFTENRALSLFKLVELKKEQKILDVATGTGFIAIEASKKVGNKGKVIALDFSPKMLQRCQQKINDLGLTNIELINNDVDQLAFANESFDVIFCSSAIVIFRDIIQVLRDWFNWLKPNGYIAFSYYSAESFFTPVIMKVCSECGYNLPNFHTILNPEEKCREILTNIGYKVREFQHQQQGKYLTLAEAQDWWQGNWLHPQYHPLLTITATERDNIKAKFRDEIAKLQTEKGVWYESKIFFVTAQKT